MHRNYSGGNRGASMFAVLFLMAFVGLLAASYDSLNGSPTFAVKAKSQTAEAAQTANTSSGNPSGSDESECTAPSPSGQIDPVTKQVKKVGKYCKPSASKSTSNANSFAFSATARAHCQADDSVKAGNCIVRYCSESDPDKCATAGFGFQPTLVTSYMSTVNESGSVPNQMSPQEVLSECGAACTAQGAPAGSGQIGGAFNQATLDSAQGSLDNCYASNACSNDAIKNLQQQTSVQQQLNNCGYGGCDAATVQSLQTQNQQLQQQYRDLETNQSVLSPDQNPITTNNSAVSRTGIEGQDSTFPTSRGGVGLPEGGDITTSDQTLMRRSDGGVDVFTQLPDGRVIRKTYTETDLNSGMSDQAVMDDARARAGNFNSSQGASVPSPNILFSSSANVPRPDEAAKAWTEPDQPATDQPKVQADLPGTWHPPMVLSDESPATPAPGSLSADKAAELDNLRSQVDNNEPLSAAQQTRKDALEAELAGGPPAPAKSPTIADTTQIDPNKPPANCAGSEDPACFGVTDNRNPVPDPNKPYYLEHTDENGKLVWCDQNSNCKPASQFTPPPSQGGPPANAVPRSGATPPPGGGTTGPTGGGGGNQSGGGGQGGGGSGAGGLMSLLSGLLKGLSTPSAPPPAPAQACSTDSTTYQQQQQQYQTALQQYNYQLQQYNYQLQLNAQYNNSVAPIPPQQPTACSPSTQNQCSTQPQQPAASTCSQGTWQPVYSGSCITRWQCGGAGTASLSCQPQTADVGMSIAISYSCSSGTATGSGFTASGQSGTSTATVATPPQGTNTATYSLSCDNNGQTFGAQCSIQVATPSIVLVANPKTVQSGGTSQIGWITSGMQSCVISSPDQPDFTAQNAANTSVGGTAETGPVTTNSTFKLDCTTISGQTRSATAAVTVGQ